MNIHMARSLPAGKINEGGHRSRPLSGHRRRRAYFRYLRSFGAYRDSIVDLVPATRASKDDHHQADRQHHQSPTDDEPSGRATRLNGLRKEQRADHRASAQVV
jgi:hypothetical protein